MALREAVDEEREFAPAKQHNRAVPDGPALSLSGDALHHDTAAEIGIDLASVDAPDGIAKRSILHSLTFGKAGERLGLERTQSVPRQIQASNPIP